jgi:hypothetical protein
VIPPTPSYALLYQKNLDLAVPSLQHSRKYGRGPVRKATVYGSSTINDQNGHRAQIMNAPEMPGGVCDFSILLQPQWRKRDAFFPSPQSPPKTGVNALMAGRQGGPPKL